jgi:PTS system nitrogen regulatory IIA component
MVQDISSTNKFDAISELIHKAPGLAQVRDLDRFEDCVVSREKLQSTGLGRGVAVAHGKTDLVDRIIVALGISQDGIPFDSPDQLPVNLLFLIASPPEKGTDYLVTLSTLAGLIRHNGLKQELLSCPTPEAARRLIADRFRVALQEKQRKSRQTNGNRMTDLA